MGSYKSAEAVINVNGDEEERERYERARAEGINIGGRRWRGNMITSNWDHIDGCCFAPSISGWFLMALTSTPVLPIGASLIHL